MNNWQEWVVGVLIVLCIARVIYGIYLFFRRTRDDELATAIPAAMDALAKDLYDRALENREKRTYSATTMDEIKQIAKEHTGFIKTMWCGDLACEEAMKEQAGLSSRCMPFAQEHLSDVCPVCGKPAQKMVVWGVAY